MRREVRYVTALLIVRWYLTSGPTDYSRRYEIENMRSVSEVGRT